ncbi:probable glutamate receptor [Tigriopus californicus]|uniref:probable glutamate receptor n=1 Tax=Tigriopus californicus TaxID=6832 RepID=UPI0027DA1E4B|nr:probable glutamate receptor [Tigriopus californicus]
MKCGIFLVYLILNVLKVSSESLSDFLVGNGRKYVCIHSYLSDLSAAKLIVRNWFAENEVYFSWNKAYQPCSKRSFNVFIMDDSLTGIENITLYLPDLTIRSSMIFVINSSSKTLENIRKHVRGFKGSSFFYVGLWNTSATIQYYQVITFLLNGAYVIQKLELDGNAKIIENYDLQGTEIVSQSLDWFPYFTIEANGTSYGYLIDLTSYCAKMFNFTYRSIVEPNNDWGMQSQFGKNLSGVLGNVIQNKVDMSLSLWVWNENRDRWVDFSIIGTDREQFCFYPQMPKIDPTLFLRPFTNDSWIAIALTSIVLVICAAIPMCIRYLNNSMGYKMISTSGWYFFVLLNAFYGGALTMFFANEPSFPFLSVQDVVDAYPSWSLKVQKGNEVFILANASPEKPEFQTLYDRLIDEPEKNLYSNYEDVLSEARSSQTMFHVFLRHFTGFLRQHPQQQGNLRTFARGRRQDVGIIFPKNSPLVPIFRLGIQRLRERGSLNFLSQRWDGSFKGETFQVDRMVLSGGQIILVYVLMGLGFSLCLFCLIIECFWKKVANSRPSKC